MIAGINMKKVWFDDDMIELKIDVSDGTSLFSTKVYVGYGTLANVVAALSTFRDHVHGGVYDILFGEFGPEYANGAFSARLHFARPGKLNVTCKMESDFAEFSVNKVATQATLYLRTEPVLLDNFISEMTSLNAKRRDDATLEAIEGQN
jgi:hypothetical protein